MSRVHHIVRQTVVALAHQNKAIIIFNALIMPALIGILTTYYSDFTKISPPLFWITLACILAIAIVSARFTWDIKLAPELMIELYEADDKIKNLGSTTDYLSLLQERALMWSAMARIYMKSTTHNTGELHGAITQICDTIAEERDQLFGFKRNELWSFAAYIYDPEKRLLVPIWRRKHPHHPSSGPGRTWAAGSGHIGLAFRDCATKITSDAAAPEIRELVTPVKETQPYDATTYRSFVSEPIGPVENGRPPIGVLVATSNVVGRFHLGNALVFRHAASAIATLLCMAYSDNVLTALAEHPWQNTK